LFQGGLQKRLEINSGGGRSSRLIISHIYLNVVIFQRANVVASTIIVNIFSFAHASIMHAMNKITFHRVKYQMTNIDQINQEMYHTVLFRWIVLSDILDNRI
jgi:hypothetical protein